jgi:hypothetical protein
MGLAGFAVPPGFLHHHGAAALGPRFASLAASVVGANNRQHEPGGAVDLGTGGVIRRRVLQLSEDSASEGASPKKGNLIIPYLAVAYHNLISFGFQHEQRLIIISRPNSTWVIVVSDVGFISTRIFAYLSRIVKQVFYISFFLKVT